MRKVTLMLLAMVGAVALLTGCESLCGKGNSCPLKAEKAATCSKSEKVETTGKCCKSGEAKDAACAAKKACPMKAEKAESCKGKDAKADACPLKAASCPKCGELSGTDKCCKPGATKCPACKLNAGSPGCCSATK